MAIFPPIDTLTLQDARDEVARLRAELEQQRTRADAAEQELRDERDNATVLSGACRQMQAKLAAARAHLAGVDVEALAKLNKSATGGIWTDEKPGRDENGWPMASVVAATPGRQQIYTDAGGGTFPHADCKLLVALRNAATALLAAAREVLS